MDFYWESCKMNKPISFVSHWIWHDLLRLQQKTNINIYVYDIYWFFFFSTFLARIIAMQMLHDAIYHFPLTLLKQSFTIWEPLRSSGPCHRHCFPGSLGSTLLLSRSLASGWRKSECPGGGLFPRHQSILTIRTTTPRITKPWPLCPREVPRCQLMHRPYT